MAIVRFAAHLCVWLCVCVPVPGFETASISAEDASKVHIAAHRAVVRKVFSSEEAALGSVRTHDVAADGYTGNWSPLSAISSIFNRTYHVAAESKKDELSVFYHEKDGRGGSCQGGGSGTLGMMRSKYETKDESSAKFSWVPCFTDRNENAKDAKRTPFTPENLPPRSQKRPYLVWAGGMREDICDFKPLRSDIIYAHFDLRGHCIKNDSVDALLGVTMPPQKFYSGPIHDATKPAKYFPTFRGSLTSQGNQYVRWHLQKIYEGLNRKDVVVKFFDRKYKYDKHDAEEYNALLDTAYALVPHGDQRWNFRFAEVVGACAIPVLIADGLTLPYSQLIDWEHASIRLTEAAVDKALNETQSTVLERPGPGSSKLGLVIDQEQDGQGTNSRLMRLLANPQALLTLLPSDVKTIQAMRQNVCQIHSKYFATEEARLEAVLQSALIITQQGHSH